MIKKTLVAPSLLAANPACLGEEMRDIETNGANWFHIDVMDGVFVSNLSFGAHIVEGLRQVSPLFFDVHLMTIHPERHAEAFIKAGADALTVHVEACDYDTIMNLAQKCKQRGVKFGLSLCPETPVERVSEFASVLDILLVMSVNPGYGNQAFIENSPQRIKQAKNLLEKTDRKFLISVDGGINPETAALCRDAGADVLVSGSYIFGAPNRKDSIERIRGLY